MVRRWHADPFGFLQPKAQVNRRFEAEAGGRHLCVRIVDADVRDDGTARTTAPSHLPLGIPVRS
jgi:hypothetical protein